MSDEQVDESEQLYRQLEGLYLAGGDMHSVLLTARYLQGLHPDAPGQVERVPPEVRRILETGMFVAYARPFTNTRFRRLARVRGISKDLHHTHEEILRRRNTVYAHTDETQLRRTIELADPAGREAMLRDQWEADLHEEWSEVTITGLDDVAELAAAHLGKVLEEIEKLSIRILNLGND